VKSLNPRQREAVEAIGGPVLVLAGAGSGKTSVITQKIAWLVEQRGMSPQHIAAVTFTNKAAREMKSRVRALLGDAANELNVSTFHTLGLRIAREEHEALGLRRNLSILDSEDSFSQLRELMRAEVAKDKSLLVDVQRCVSRWKNELIDPAQAQTLAANPVEVMAARVYPEYDRYLRACNAVDFDDLIALPVRLLRDDEQRRAAWRERIRYLLVDEYQDTNVAQYQLVRLLAGDRGALTVVGDDDQSIYTWRGAHPENLKLLQRDFPELRVIKLEQNYRSSGRILKAANSLIANNEHVFEKRLWSELGYGDPIRILRTTDEEHEVERVVAEIQHHRFRHRSRHGDYAILFRGNHQARMFEQALREQRIPYALSGSSSWFDRSEVRDLIAYLRLLVNPDDDSAFLRVVNTPRREIGPATLEKLARYAGGRKTSLVAASLELGLEQQLNARQITMLRVFTDWLHEAHTQAQDRSPMESVRALLDDIAYEDWLRDSSGDAALARRRITSVNDFIDWLGRMERDAGEDGATLEALVTRIALLDMLDRQEDSDASDEVALMTLHAAKGLEFPHVFIAGFEEGLLPHHSALEEDRLSEERRLAYVGITRAQRSLTLSFAASRKRQGEQMDCEPSRFLSELPQEDLAWEGKGHELPPEERQERGRAYLANLREMLNDAE
jgi:ATP-dependent DNA helicase Rep